MLAISLPPDADAELFKPLARRALSAGFTPDSITFITNEAPLIPSANLPEASLSLSVPRGYVSLCNTAAMHSSDDRFDLLYALLWRILHGERQLISRAADPVVSRLLRYEKAVRRDIHKMHAFVRFRQTIEENTPLYVAWFEPQHHILRAAAPFFRDRFSGMDWVIATPGGTALWKDGELSFAAPGPRPKHVADDALDELWLTYYRTTFNPARLRIKAMTAEMPKHYWHAMPETALLPDMIARASGRADEMRALTPNQAPRFAEKAAPSPRPMPLPDTPLEALRIESAICTRCPLHQQATQTVFGEGPPDAELVFVGEQPGDQEDIAGRPFVGPAGRLLNRALEEAGIERSSAYFTNAVKHFKHEPRGKRRLHKRPNGGEIDACRWWLMRELKVLRPKLVVALGATAAQSLTGRQIAIQRERGTSRFGELEGLITVHPSFLLRLPGIEEKEREYKRFVDDLRSARSHLLNALAA